MQFPAYVYIELNDSVHALCVLEERIYNDTEDMPFVKSVNARQIHALNKDLKLIINFLLKKKYRKAFLMNLVLTDLLPFIYHNLVYDEIENLKNVLDGLNVHLRHMLKIQDTEDFDF